MSLSAILAHLDVKSAINAHVSWLKSQKKPVKKVVVLAVSCWCQMKKPDWLSCHGLQKALAIFHIECREKFLSSF